MWIAPAVMLVNVCPPKTALGSKIMVLKASFDPIWPNPLLPQHKTGPSVLKAQVCAAPVAKAEAVLGPPNATATGTLDGPPQQVPCPSVAKPLLPQHHTAPSLIAHVCTLPALAEVTPLAMFETPEGVSLSMNVPSPSWPYALLPQQDIAPDVIMAQE